MSMHRFHYGFGSFANKLSMPPRHCISTDSLVPVHFAATVSVVEYGKGSGSDLVDFSSTQCPQFTVA